MAILSFLLCLLLSFSPSHQASTDGITALVQRRMPNHVNQFQFQLVDDKGTNATVNDRYNVLSGADGKVVVQGNSASALAIG